MAGLARFFRRSFLSPHSRALVQLLQSPTHAIPVGPLNSRIQNPQIQCRNFMRIMSDMRREVFNYNEIQCELDRSPPQQLPKEVNGFAVDQRPGDQRLKLEKRFGDDEEIKVEATMFDGSVPVPKYVGVKESGQVAEEEIMQIALIVSIFKDGNDNVLEFSCSAWEDNMEIDEIYIRSRGQMPEDTYMGPGFEELDEQLQDQLYEFLENRGIGDDLCGFLHKYVPKKDNSEYDRWMNTLLSFIKNKAS